MALAIWKRLRAGSTSREGAVNDAEAMGRDAAEELKASAGPGFF